jgi:hypothetical protein
VPRSPHDPAEDTRGAVDLLFVPRGETEKQPLLPGLWNSRLDSGRATMPASKSCADRGRSFDVTARRQTSGYKKST